MGGSFSAAKLDQILDAPRAQFKDLLKEEVRLALFGGMGGRAIARRIETYADAKIRGFAEQAGLPSALEKIGFAAAAVGGCGARVRGLMSDIDLVLVGADESVDLEPFSPQIRKFVDQMYSLHPTFDPLTRVPSDLERLFTQDNDDNAYLHAFLTARPLFGSLKGYDAFQAAVDEFLKKHREELLSYIWKNLEERWDRNGRNPSMVGVDIKEGMGGLRDCDALRWIGHILQRTGTLHEWADLSPDGFPRKLMRAFDQILLTKEVLHLAAADDQWRRDHKTTLDPWRLTNLFLNQGYDIERARFWTARLTRRYFTAAQQVSQFVEEVLERRAGRNAPSSSPAGDTPLAEILQKRGEAGAQLRDLHRRGKLVKDLRSFAPLRGFAKPETYHSYTTDEHSLQAVELLDKVLRGEVRELADVFSRLNGVKNIRALYLATLLHDSGMPREKKKEPHEIISGRRIKREASLLGFSPEEQALAARLGESHLSMSKISQTMGNATSPEILRFARLVGDKEFLSLLFLLTYVDRATTTSQGWAGLRLSWLVDLYTRTYDHLEGLAPQRIQYTGEVQSHLQLLPPQYEVALCERQIRRHTALARELIGSKNGDGRKIKVEWDFSREEAPELILAATDYPGLFRDVLHLLAKHQIPPSQIFIFTRQDGISCDVFVCRRSDDFTEAASLKFLDDLRTCVETEKPIVLGAFRPRQGSPGVIDPVTRQRFEVGVEPAPEQMCSVLAIRHPEPLAVAPGISAIITDMRFNISYAKAEGGHRKYGLFVHLNHGNGGGPLWPDEESALVRRVAEYLESLPKK